MENEEREDDPRNHWRDAGIGAKLKRLEEKKVQLIHVNGPGQCFVGIVTQIITLKYGEIQAVYFDPFGSLIVNRSMVNPFYGTYSVDQNDVTGWHWAEDHE